jgi:hypothetical protein
LRSPPAMNRIKNLFIFCLPVLIAGLAESCKKETVELSSKGSTYFPVTNHKWVLYDVDSVYHAENDNNNDDSVYTYNFQVKEVLDSFFIDGAGRANQIVKHYRRNDSLSAWSLTNVWTQVVISTGAYRTEENIPVHKLTFPLSSDVIWNANDANTLEPQMYSYEYLHQPGTFNGLSFDSTLSVLEVDENNYVERLFGREVYAAGVGLVFKEEDDLGKRNGIIVKGLEYKMKVLEYGIE